MKKRTNKVNTPEAKARAKKRITQAVIEVIVILALTAAVVSVIRAYAGKQQEIDRSRLETETISSELLDGF